MKAFPNAKVLLTKRTPESWYTSVKSSILPMKKLSETWVTGTFMALMGEFKGINTARGVSLKVPSGQEHSELAFLKK